MIIIDEFQGIHFKDAYPKSNEEIEQIVKKLKMMANKLNTKMVVTSLLSRNIEKRTNKRPKITDIRGGKTLGELSVKVFMIYREKYYDSRKNTDKLEPMEIKDIKNENTFNCSFDNKLGRIKEIEN